jgi:aminoglycoside 6'-N-acetyltransferase
LSSLEAKYGPGIDGLEPVYVFVVQHGSTPIGWIQWYRWQDFPEHAAQLGADATSAGIDLAIGEVEMTGRGLGPAMIRTFGTTHIFANLDIAAIVADPAADNSRSVTAFRKAGFRTVGTVRLAGEAFDRSVVRFERVW